jgi:LemA protein
VILLMASGYYYNRLLLLEQDVKAAWANVEALQARRSHIRRNLTALLRYYAQYEQGLMTDLTKMRTDNREPTRGPPKEETVNDLLGRLNAVAEQYPNLQLTNTVQQITNSTINSETDIAFQIIRYNEVTNVYITALHTFPASVFGRVLGFRDHPLYKPESSELGFVEMKP